MTEFALDETYYYGLIDATVDQEKLRGSMEEGTGIIEDNVSTGEWGHHRIRRALSPLYQTPIWLAKVGLISKEQQKMVQSIYLASATIIGFYLMYWAITNTVRILTSTQQAIAVTETTAHLIAQDYAGVAMALIAAASVATGFAVGYQMARNETVTVKADYTTWDGRTAIARSIRAQRRDY